MPDAMSWKGKRNLSELGPQEVVNKIRNLCDKFKKKHQADATVVTLNPEEKTPLLVNAIWLTCKMIVVSDPKVRRYDFQVS